MRLTEQMLESRRKTVLESNQSSLFADFGNSLESNRLLHSQRVPTTLETRRKTVLESNQSSLFADFENSPESNRLLHSQRFQPTLNDVLGT